jgi:hypothetical protein
MTLRRCTVARGVPPIAHCTSQVYLEECRVAQASRFYMMMYVLYVYLYLSSHDTYAGIDGLLVFRIVTLEYLGAIPE